MRAKGGLLASVEQDQTATEGIVEEMVQAVQNARGCSAHKQVIGEVVPKKWECLSARKSPILGFNLQLCTCCLTSLFLLLGAGPAARVIGSEGLKFFTSIGSQQISGQFQRVDSQGKVKSIVDDVLGQVEADVKDVFPRDPASFNAVLVLGALLAKRESGKLAQLIGTEHLGSRTINLVA